MSLIVRLGGTHGSGKSSVVAAILAKYPRVETLYGPANKRGERREREYVVQIPTGLLSIIGPYNTPCGGCDAIQPFSGIWPLVSAAYKRGNNVLFEGALLSSSYGIQIGQASEEFGHNVVFALMDTPVTTCLRRVNERRAARFAEAGKPFTPIKPAQTEAKFKGSWKAMETAAERGRRAVFINHTHPVQDVMKLFGVRLTKEPAR